VTIAFYPVLRGLAFPFKWTPTFFNMPSSIATSGASIDVGLAQFPLHTFELTYEWLPDAGSGLTDFRNLLGFFMTQGGTLGRFWYQNPDDNTVLGGFVGTGDGITTLFGPIPRLIANTALAEPVGLIAPGTFGLNVYLNGVLQSSSGYTIGTTVPLNQTITFGTAPGAGVVITMDFVFYYYCRFADNIVTFEKFSYERWLVSKVTLQSCRQGA
jgi:hypothetical protein